VPSAEICIESGQKRVFASALAWPGWSRSAPSEEAAIEALIAYGPRYAKVLAARKLGFAPPKTVEHLKIVERVPGNGTTDFGAPAVAATWEETEIDGKDLKRLLSILDAGWAALDRSLAKASGARLLTGPRGGGRTAEKILAHIRDAEAAYLRKIGGAGSRPSGIAGERAGLVEAFKRAATGGVPGSGPRGGKMWTPRYLARRTVWHVLDHTWEIDDRLEA